MEFVNLRYSAAWLAEKFPGFYNEECYHILADYFRNNISPNLSNFESHENKSVQNISKKRKIDHGPCAEFLEPVREDMLDVEGELSERDACTDLHSDGESESTTGQHRSPEHEPVDDEPTGSSV